MRAAIVRDVTRAERDDEWVKIPLHTWMVLVVAVMVVAVCVWWCACVWYVCGMRCAWCVVRGGWWCVVRGACGVWCVVCGVRCVG